MACASPWQEDSSDPAPSARQGDLSHATHVVEDGLVHKGLARAAGAVDEHGERTGSDDGVGDLVKHDRLRVVHHRPMGPRRCPFLFCVVGGFPTNISGLQARDVVVRGRWQSEVRQRLPSLAECLLNVQKRCVLRVGLAEVPLEVLAEVIRESLPQGHGGGELAMEEQHGEETAQRWGAP
eukprot:3296830-Pyramimonas_sp.AAC.2